MRAGNTLSLILFILLIPGILSVVLLWFSPSGLQELVANMIKKSGSGAFSQSSYSIVIFGLFVYVIGLTSAVASLVLTELVKRVYG